MMSLFTSFDLGLFKLSLFFYFLCFYFLHLGLNFISSYKTLVMFFFNFFFNFMNSIKNKSSSKFSFFFLISIFYSIFILNFFSVLPFNFPLMTQPSIIIIYSLGVWISFMIFHSLMNFKGVLSHLIPEGSPLGLVFVLFIIEIVSIIIRPLTLTVRLCANILAGHLLMILLSKLVLIVFPLSMIYMILNLVELFVGLIQSYIFCTLLTLYFSEVN